MAATATVTVIATVTQTIVPPTATETVMADFVPKYIESYSGNLSFLNLALIFSNLIVIAVLSTFNRLIAIPLVAASCMCVGNALDWVGWLATTTYSANSRRVAIILSNVFYCTHDQVISLYSFILLEKILSGSRRRLFIIVYVFLYFALIGTRAPMIAALDKYSTEPESEGPAIGRLVEKLTRASIVIMSSLESWSAFFLIRAFYCAKKQTSNFGGIYSARMWASLARSTELRVSLLAVICITRLICFRSYESTNQVLKVLDWFAFVMMNCFPFVLQLDLLSSKMLRYEATAAQRRSLSNLNGIRSDESGEGRGGNVDPAVRIEAGNVSGSSTKDSGMVTVDSLGPDYAYYGMGTGFNEKGSTSTSTPVA